VIQFLANYRQTVGVVLGVVAALGIGAAAIALTIHDRRAHAETAEAKLLLGVERETALALRLQVAELEKTKLQLVESVRAQNQAIQDLKRHGAELEAAATVRAMRALQEGEARRRAILTSTGEGPQEMNSWLRDSLPQ
jgi:hypothetical protein